MNQYPKKKKKSKLGTVIFLLFISPSILAEKINLLNKYTIQDSTLITKLYKARIPKFEIDTLTFYEDERVLNIVSGWNQLFYPFGRYQYLTSLRKSFSKNAVISFNKFEDVRLYVVKDKNIKVNFILDNPRTEYKYFEIVSGEIISKNIVLFDKIKIGTSKSDFLNFFFYPLENNNILEKIDKIEIESLVFGIKISCLFEKNILTKIRIN